MRLDVGAFSSLAALATARLMCVAVLSATLPAVLLTPNASAALALRYDPPEASPGTVVSVETVGGSGISFRETPRLSLASAKAADEIKGPTDPRLSPIGELEFDEEGVGRLTFTVPDVPPGLYLAVVGRGPITAPEAFRVTAVDSAGVPSDSGGGDGGVSTGVLIVLVAAGILLAATGAVLVTRRYRRRASPR
jgi:hypothetical protein